MRASAASGDTLTLQKVHFEPMDTCSLTWGTCKMVLHLQWRLLAYISCLRGCKDTKKDGASWRYLYLFNNKSDLTGCIRTVQRWVKQRLASNKCGHHNYSVSLCEDAWAPAWPLWPYPRHCCLPAPSHRTIHQALLLFSERKRGLCFDAGNSL